MFLKKRLKKIYKNKIKRIKNRYNKKLEKERNRFISVLNHDVKTPLLAQIQTLELLLGGSFDKLTKNQEEIIKEILKSNCFLYEIVSSAIFLAQYENETPELKLENVDIIKQIEDCCDLVKSYALDKNQEFVIKTNRSKNITVNADRKLIQKIIFNLLASSVSSGFENSLIEICVKENKKSVSFCAKNRSVYMTKEKINTLFEEKKNTRDFNQLGMSLNLNVVKKLIEAHNWDIVAQSKKNNSSTFGFVVKR